jgi:hypothetical protein
MRLPAKVLVLAERIAGFFVRNCRRYGCWRIGALAAAKCGFCWFMNQDQLQALQKRRVRVKTTQTTTSCLWDPTGWGTFSRRSALTGLDSHQHHLSPAQYRSAVFGGEMDPCSKRMGGWKLAASLATSLVVGAFARAVRAWSRGFTCGFEFPTKCSTPMASSPV